MNASELHALTGAYAMNALDDDEREEFEQHLADCETCATEVEEFRATAAALGSAIAEPPPATLKGDVLAAIREERQEPPRAGTGPPDTTAGGWRTGSPAPAWARRLLAPAAAVLAIVVVGLSVVVGNLNQRIDELEGGDVISEVVAAPDLQTWEVTTAGGSTARVVFSPARGEGWLLASGMPSAPEGKVYELWLISGEDATPAGLFDAGADGTVAHAVTGDLGRVDALGVTVEPAGGSPAPTSDPVMVIEL